MVAVLVVVKVVTPLNAPPAVILPLVALMFPLVVTLPVRVLAPLSF